MFGQTKYYENLTIVCSSCIQLSSCSFKRESEEFYLRYLNLNEVIARVFRNSLFREHYSKH